MRTSVKALLLVFMLPLSICAQTVPNEQCSGAINLTPSEFGQSTWQVNSLGNTSSGAACIGNANDDVWYHFTALSSNDIILAQDPVAVYDAVIELYSSCGGTSIGCGNAYGPGLIERYKHGGLTAGQTYYFRVFNADASAGAGLQVQVQIKTFADARLRDQDCGRMNLQLQDVVLAERQDQGQLYISPVVGVSGYGFWFKSIDGTQSQVVQQTNAYPFSFQLVNIPWLQYGQMYEVQIQHRVTVAANGNTQDLWSGFGETCLIGLNATPPSTQLRPQFCGATVTENTTVLADQVTGAEMYRFTFSGPEGAYVATTPNYGLLLSTVGAGNALIQGNTYQVIVECQIAGNWSDPGTVCALTIQCQEAIPPTMSSYPANILATCGNNPAVPVITSIDTEAGSRAVTLDIKNFSSSDKVHQVLPNLTGTQALYLTGITGVPDYFTWSSAPVYLIETVDGAYLSGELQATDGSNAKWEVHLELDNKANWTAWNSQNTVSPPFIPRSYKDDQGHAAAAGNAWTAWNYYVIDSEHSFLRGKGNLNGSFLSLSQSPSSLLFGFQMGTAANNISPDVGFSSWINMNGTVNGNLVSATGTLTSRSVLQGTMESIACQPWISRTWYSSDACGNKMATDQLIIYPLNLCQDPTNMDVVEIGFGTLNPRVNGTWSNPEGSNDCQVRGGRLLNGSYESGNPAFHNLTNTQVIGQTNGSTLNFNIALYNNPNVPFKLGKHYGFEVRCSCANGTGYSEWSGLSTESSFLVPYPPGIQEIADGEKSIVQEKRTLKLSPNPGNGRELLIQLSSLVLEKEQSHIQIYDLRSRVLFDQWIQSDIEGNGLVIQPRVSLEPGMYIVLLNSGDERFQATWVVE